MRRRLVIFAGAHKTASSHLQHSLLGSQTALADLGIAAIGPKTMRQDLTPLSQLLRDGMTPEVVRAGADGFLQHHGGDADTVALMDENILGGTDRKMLLRKTRLYPWAPGRMARLLDLFDGHDIQLALATRNPATFFPSCWGESLHHGRYDDFADYIRGFDPARPIWTELTDRLKETCPTLKIMLWRYEDYAQLGPALFGHLLKPEAENAVQLDPKIRRAGLSQRAAEWFQTQETRGKDIVQEARQRYPKTGPETAYVPWSGEELAQITASYDHDLTQARQRDGVILLAARNARDA
ncbi:MAG: hypothetical protein AAFZ10_11485 [Pseudomonadota bacterium]